jgi:hypothetical protein
MLISFGRSGPVLCQLPAVWPNFPSGISLGDRIWCFHMQFATAQVEVGSRRDIRAFGPCRGTIGLMFESDSFLTVIHGAAFAMWEGLDSIRIPASVREISARAFMRCRYLSTVTLDSNWLGVLPWMLQSLKSHV